MLLHDTVDGVEAQARAVPYRLCGEERFEDPAANLRRNSGPAVANLYEEPSKLGRSSHHQLAAAVHRVDCVVDEIRPDLIQLAPMGADRRDRAIIFPNHVNPILQAVMKHDQRIFQALMNIDLMLRGLVHIRILLDGANQVCHPRSSALDLFHQAIDRERCGQASDGIGQGLVIEPFGQAVQGSQVAAGIHQARRQLSRVLDATRFQPFADCLLAVAALE